MDPSPTPAAGPRARQVEAKRSLWSRVWHLHWSDVGRALLGVVGASIGWLLAAWAVPGFDIGPWPNAPVLAVLVGVVGFVLRPVLISLAVVLGWAGSILLGLFGQALIVWLVVQDADRADGDGSVRFMAAFAAAWVIAGVSTLFGWVMSSGTDEAATATLLRRARRARRRGTEVADPEVPGVVFVQIDGVPYPLLEWGVRAGTLPTLSRWMRSGSHQMAEWRPQLPATTPASQMGILHGTIDGIPAFRWWDRSEAKVYVSNQPADAALIEARHSDGRGLLADDGVVVSTLFTGDAPTAYATMSAVNRTQQTRATRRALGRFLAQPSGMARSITRAVSEVVRERFQASRAARRDVRPRVHRGWNFALERAGLNGVLRDLNTSLVADAILAGRRSIYVNYVDYDAVAHHAGILQPESLDALSGVDAVLTQLEEVIGLAPRSYHVVVLSDHGQSQGAVFADRYGEDLEAVVRRLSQGSVHQPEFKDEGSGTLSGTLDSVLTTGSHAGPAAEEDAEFMLFGSGNLGLVYVVGECERLVREALDERFPQLVPGLAAHPGVGFVVVDTAEFGPVAVGADGEHRVRSGEVLGVDPLAGFGPEAPEFVLRAASMPEAPDIYVNSLVDEFGEVAAFEGLVGAHGGLGGWQDRGMLVWPSSFTAPDGMIVRADALHEVLVGWLEDLGHRKDLRAS